MSSSNDNSSWLDRFSKLPEHNIVGYLCVVLSILYIVCMSLLGSHAQSKVYFICVVICFTTVVVGTTMNNSMRLVNVSLLSVAMNLSLIVFVLIPQIKYYAVVTKYSDKIKTQSDLEYHTHVVVMSTISMCFCLYAFSKWNVRDYKSCLMVALLLFGVMIGECVIIDIMENHLKKHTDPAPA